MGLTSKPFESAVFFIAVFIITGFGTRPKLANMLHDLSHVPTGSAIFGIIPSCIVAIGETAAYTAPLSAI